jgi:hypothetical protein
MLPMKRLFNLPMTQLLRLQLIQMLFSPTLLGKLFKFLFFFFFWAGLDGVPFAACVALV